MTTSEERALYETDRAAWIEQAAPKLANRFDAMTNEAINHMWNVASDALKQIIWGRLDNSQRNRVRSVRAGRAA